MAGFPPSGESRPAEEAANWIPLGEAQGRGKLDVGHRAELAKKTVWVYPLTADFRHTLCA